MKRFRSIVGWKPLTEVAPPGREDQVKDLKKKFPGDKAAAFKIAWWSYKNRKKK